MLFPQRRVYLALFTLETHAKSHGSCAPILSLRGNLKQQPTDSLQMALKWPVLKHESLSLHLLLVKKPERKERQRLFLLMLGSLRGQPSSRVIFRSLDSMIWDFAMSGDSLSLLNNNQGFRVLMEKENAGGKTGSWAALRRGLVCVFLVI